MFFKVLICTMAASVAVVNAGAAVFTATREYNTITNVAPFIVKATTTIVWTYVIPPSSHWFSQLLFIDKAPPQLSPNQLVQVFN
ncbi:hypothetical protein C8J57DRAFT_1273937 [Mycena rebaudengoi]|nr:hypothetical protein C8J57DRAFT_1273937 [Mycena rebaudengoi]